MPNRGKIGAIVLGGGHGALAIVRSLGRRGIPVSVWTNNAGLARFSRYAHSTVSWPGAQDSNAQSLSELADKHRQNGWMLFPCGDEEARLIAQNHDALSGKFRLSTPAWETVQWVYDKRLTYHLARELGLDIPRSYEPRNRDELALLDVQFPAILKPTVKRTDNAFTLEKAWRVNDRRALLSRYDEAVEYVGTEAVIIQELIPGNGSVQFSYAGIWDQGSAVASLVARRRRQYPREFGYTSTFVETIENHELELLASRFLEAIGFSGPVEMEFKYDARSGQYKLLDINARAWTWIAIGDKAGIDLPYVAWQIASGEKPAPIKGRPGERWMYASRDIVAACGEMAAGTLTAKAYLASFRGRLAFAAFASDDPMPAIVDLPLTAYRVMTRRLPASVLRKIGDALRGLNLARSHTKS